jgi:hypothetical protein
VPVIGHLDEFRYCGVALLLLERSERDYTHSGEDFEAAGRCSLPVARADLGAPLEPDAANG